METTTVRISLQTRDVLRDLAVETGEPMQRVLLKAVDAYRRQVFFDRLDSDYAALQADPVAWQEVLDERREWDTTLMDGLEDE